jgi:hypothetical protein
MVLCRRIGAGRPVAHVAAEMGVSRTCAYRWWARYRQQGAAGLVDRPSRAHHHPRRTPAHLEAAVLELRQARKLGPARIAPLVGLPASTVHGSWSVTGSCREPRRVDRCWGSGLHGMPGWFRGGATSSALRGSGCRVVSCG